MANTIYSFLKIYKIIEIIFQKYLTELQKEKKIPGAINKGIFHRGKQKLKQIDS